MQPPSRVIFSARKPWRQWRRSCTFISRNNHHLLPHESATEPAPDLLSSRTTIKASQNQSASALRILHAVATTIIATTPPSLQNNNGNVTLHHRKLHATAPTTPENQNLFRIAAEELLQQLCEPKRRRRTEQRRTSCIHHRSATRRGSAQQPPPRRPPLTQLHPCWRNGAATPEKRSSRHCTLHLR